MRTAYIRLLPFLFCVLISCSPKVVTVVEKQVEHDSVFIEKIDTVTIISEEKATSVTLMDSSHVETSLAVSDAWTDSIGLHHTIQNKPGIMKESRIVTRIEYKDSIIFKPEPFPVVEYVEKPLKKWQLCLMYIGVATILILAVRLAYRFKK